MGNIKLFGKDEPALPKVYTDQQRNDKIQALKQEMDENNQGKPSPIEFLKAGLSVYRQIGFKNLLETFLTDANLLAASIAVHAEERREAAKLLAEKNQTENE